MSFTDQKSRIVTEHDVTSDWGGRRDNFRCRMCGHTFQIGDYWRWVYTNDMPNAGGNPMVCESCDGDDVKKRWEQMCNEAYTKFWWFTRGD